MKREFIYFEIFDKNWRNLDLTDKDLIELENTINNNPDIGKLIQGTGGLRKLRFALPNKGKSGSVRILYIDFISYEKTIFMNVYAKNEKDTISKKEKQMYKTLIDELIKIFKRR